ncbi:hypothetical protein ACP4OV_020158 [Aristida adscensionis]
MEKDTTPCPVEANGETRNDASSVKNQNPETLEHQVLQSTSGTMQNTLGIRKNYKRAANRGKKGSQVPTDKRYTLRSADNNVRVLLSAPNSSTTPAEPLQAPVQPPTERRKRGRPPKTRSPTKTNEFSQIRKRFRYILNRMNYEQSLIEAYANDGWKSQSLEKIRPEKELERAKAEILRCKLRIREVFKNLDSLLSQGKIDKSLFDSEGELSSEDIFCATCGSKDVTLGNDIILCDGACDRGFHQNCLNPPLRTEDIPAGEEGWLCPACDCKIDCIDVINQHQGSNLSIDDSWEKVFPEAAALANGPKLGDAPDLPSDDSEDDDFDPNMAEDHVANEEEGSSEDDDDSGGSDSDDNFLTSSDESEPLCDNKKVDDLGMGLPSEDSEDDDYDPAGPDSDKDIQKKQSSSDESDFSSDSDDFCAEIAKSGGHDEVSTPSLPDEKAGDAADAMGLPSEDSEDDDYDPAGPDSDKDIQKKQSSSDESDFTSDSDDFCAEIAKSGGHDEVSTPSLPDEKAGDAADAMGKIATQANTAGSGFNSMETEINQEAVLPVSGKRQVERLDYKRLYDEAYGKASSDTSDDEEWSGKSTSEKNNEEQGEADSSAGKGSTRTRAVDASDELTPKSARKGFHPGSLHGSVDKKHGDHTSNGSNNTRKSHFGPEVNQRLHEHFKIEQYPSRSVKQSLADELGLTFLQVSRWFETRRHFTKAASAKRGVHLNNHSSEKTNSPAVATVPDKDPEATVMEEPNGCGNNVVNEETSGNLNGGCKQDKAVKNRINRGRRRAATPSESNEGGGSLRKLDSPKGTSRQNHQTDASSSDVGRSNGDSAGDHIPELALVDEARKKAIQREMKRRRMRR